MQYFLTTFNSEGMDWQNKKIWANSMSGTAEVLPWPHHSGVMMACGSVHATDIIVWAAFQQNVINIISDSRLKAAYCEPP